VQKHVHRVLVVDDDRDSAQVVVELLRTMQYEAQPSINQPASPPELVQKNDCGALLCAMISAPNYFLFR